MADALKDVDAPGSFRKVGPSLRHLDSKVDYDWLYSWIRQPADFRPTTRMPQFFLHHEHLEQRREKAFPIHDADGKEVKITDLRVHRSGSRTSRFVRWPSSCSPTASRSSTSSRRRASPKPASAERGKWLFESRGCLACHSHADFPGIHSNQGPDLSRLAAKFNTEKGQQLAV